MAAKRELINTGTDKDLCAETSKANSKSRIMLAVAITGREAQSKDGGEGGARR